jgi:LysR family transcriptional activator of nhaA
MSNRAARINYKHLRYFYEIVREGSVAGAARRLHVTPQTVSSQVRSLERALGRPLFERLGRKLTLTADGEVAVDYAESIFALGAELRNVMSGRSQARRAVLRLGITDSVPKLLTARVLAPVLDRHGERLELTCVEGAAAELFGRLAAFQIDAVLAEMPVPPHLTRTMRARRLLDSGVTFLATPGLRKKLGPRFPASLDGAPLIAWPEDSPLGSSIESWCAARGVSPRIVARCDDSALMKVLAQRGLGVLCAPTVIEADVARQFGLKALGRVEELREPLYLISPAMRHANPLLDEIR